MSLKEWQEKYEAGQLDNTKPMSYEELESFLGDLEAEIGIEEMNRRLKNALSKAMETNPDMQHTAEMVCWIQEEDFEAMQIPEREADFSETEKLYRAMNHYYENPCDAAAEELSDQLVRCKLKNAAVMVPTYMLGDRMDIERIKDNSPGEWIPVYTARDAARKWPEQSDLTIMSFDAITMLAAIRDGYDGIIVNPFADDRWMAFSKEDLEKMEKECSYIKRENAKKRR